MPRGLPPRAGNDMILKAIQTRMSTPGLPMPEQVTALAEMMERQRAPALEDWAVRNARADPSLRSMRLGDNETFMNDASRNVMNVVNPLLDMFRNKPTFDEFVNDPNARQSAYIEDRREYDWGMPHYSPNHAPRHEPMREWIDGLITGSTNRRR